MKAGQARLIRRLDPGARVSPNDFGFIDGFMPVGLHAPRRLRRRRRGRPLRQLPGARPRRPRPLQPRLRREAALRPERQCAPASSCRRSTTRATGRRPATSGPGAPRRSAPAPPTSASSRRTTRASRTGACTTRCSPSRAPSGAPAFRLRRPTRSSSCCTRPPARGRPSRTAPAASATGRAATRSTPPTRCSGELAGGAFSFDADTRLLAQPARLAAARTLWMPRGDTLDRPFADALLGVGAGGRHADRDRPGRVHPDPRGRAARGRARRLDRRAPRPGAPRLGARGAAGRPRRDRARRPADACRSTPPGRGPSPRCRPGRAWWRGSSTAPPPPCSATWGGGRVLAWAADPMSPARARRAARPGPPGGRPAALGRRRHGDPARGATASPATPSPARLPWEDAVAARRGPGGAVMTIRRWG